MADYAQIMNALRNADAAGDTAAARRLAQMAIAARDSEKAAQQSPSASLPLQGAGAALLRSVEAFTGSPANTGTTLLGEANSRNEQGVGASYGADGGGESIGAPQAGRSAPSTFEEIIAKARELHAAGDIEGARRLGRIAIQRRDAAQHPRPDGRITEIPAGASDSTRQKIFAMLKPKESVNPISGMSAAALDGMTFGAGDEILAGISTAMGAERDRSGGFDWFNYDKPMGERYTRALADVRGGQEGFEEEHPYLAAGANLGGAMAAPLGAAGRFVGGGSNALARTLRGAAVGAGSGAVYGFGEGEGGASSRGFEAAKGGLLGALGGGFMAGAGEGISSAIGALRSRRLPPDTIPTLEGLRKSAGELYETARQSGAVMPSATVKVLAADIAHDLHGAGFDANLHPRVRAVLQRFGKEKGDKSLADLDILRRVASGAAESLQPDERRLAMRIIDKIDDAVDGMGGDAEALKAGREVWGRLRRMESIETAIEKAGVGDDFAAGIQTQFKAMMRNPRALKGFSDAEKSAIRAVAKGEGGVKALQWLGKTLSPKSLSGAGAAAASYSGAGLFAAMAPVGVSYGARAIAQSGAKRGAEGVRRMVGMSPAQRALVEALWPRNPLASVPGAMGVVTGDSPVRNKLAEMLGMGR